jgi:hypothetical protein
MVGPFSKRAALKKGTAGKLLKQLLLLCKKARLRKAAGQVSRP